MSHQQNTNSILKVANTLGAIKNNVVFTGGATVSLYATRPLATTIRPTDDIDVVVELLSLNDYYKLEEELLKLGFKNDQSDKPIISRFMLDDLIVDIMPTDEKVLGFGNEWLKAGVDNAVKYELSNSEVIKIFTAPYFIACKFEAFKNRGGNNMLTSHDFEDIIFVLDNRDEIETELFNADNNVKNYLNRKFTSLLQNNRFEEAVISHVEQVGQTQRKERIINLITVFIEHRVS